MLEIERKFLLNTSDISIILDRCKIINISNIEQCYMYDDIENEEIRLRKIDNKTPTYWMTYKSNIDNTLCRTEHEVEISQQLYEKMTQGIFKLHKTRTTFEDNGLRFEVDVYPLGEMICEVEFPSEILALTFNPYDYMSNEVTNDKRYRNKNIWKRYKDITTIFSEKK